MLTPRFNPSTLRDRPNTGGWLRGHSNLQFDPALEAEYARTHLFNSRTLILVTCIVATLLSLLRGAEQMVGGRWGFIGPIGLPIVILSSLTLTIIAACSAFERAYLPWARIIVPLRNVIVAAHIGAAASNRELEMLMIMPLAVIGPFFFLGFNFRMGLLCGVLTCSSFIASTILLGMELPIALRTSVFLMLSLVACAIIAKHMEKWSRTVFLETRLNADLAQHDALTGTKNRRVFDEHLTSLWPRVVEERRALAVLLIDVDHFKSYNDRYGHQAGDEALRRVAQAIQTFACRPLDVLARYGGEEFAAVLYDADAQQSMQVAERMRRAVEELNLAHQGSAFARVTISIGVAAVKPTRDRSFQGALQLADQALYDAKTGGRNRIKTVSDAEHKLLETGVFSRTSRAATVEKQEA